MPRLGGGFGVLTSPQPASQRQLHRSDLPLAEVQMATAKNGDFKKSSERRSRCVLLRHLSSRNDEIEAVGSGRIRDGIVCKRHPVLNQLFVCNLHGLKMIFVS